MANDFKKHHSEETLAAVDKQHEETFVTWLELQNFESIESAGKVAWRESRELYKLYLENATLQIAAKGTVKQSIENLFDHFFEFPTDDRTHVTSVSCKLFAQHVAEIAAQDTSSRASPKPLTDEQLVNIADELGIGSSAILRNFARAIEAAHGIAQGDE